MIVNEEDIYFNYDSDRDTLKAFTTKPLQIENKALGYNITYYLDKFEYYRKNISFTYLGNIFFKEDELITKNINKYTLIERRNEAYLGSRMQFLRNLWANQLSAAKFSITNLDGQIINYNNIVIQEAGNIEDKLHQVKKYLSYPFTLIIYYKVEVSALKIQKQRVYFEKNGNHSERIIWEGDMLKKRIGDTLPYEYGLHQ